VSEPSKIVESTPPSKSTGARATKASAAAPEEDKTEGAGIFPLTSSPSSLTLANPKW
jgi:hypothetical protein